MPAVRISFTQPGVAQVLMDRPTVFNASLNGLEPGTAPDSPWEGISLGNKQLRLTDGRTASRVAHVARTLAMLVNEAADAVQQGVCSPEGADAAILEALDRHYRGDRYRTSPSLLPP